VVARRVAENDGPIRGPEALVDDKGGGTGSVEEVSPGVPGL